MKNKIVIALLLALTACFPNYSDGDRVGYVTKLSKKGLMYKSYEGEMQLDTFTGTVGPNGAMGMTNVFEFNADDSVVPDLQKAMEQHKRVRLHYNQWGCAPPTIDHDHEINKVEFL
jgi:hypothetical protein